MADEETFEVTEEGAAAFGALATRGFKPVLPEVGIPFRQPDETWTLENGTAWVYRVPDNEALTKPVIIADGFSGGASVLREWAGLWEGSAVADGLCRERGVR
ncbi:MAG: hypothetical protein LC777_01195 [Actinobacteria bacterium]|nr:hypothetical protein [Actinomycetota bacterium]